MAGPRPHVPAAPRDLPSALRLGLGGGAVLVAAALLAALLTRVAGGDGAAALGNASLLEGMAALGLAALVGGVRISRWSGEGRGAEARLREHARAGRGGRVGLVRVSLAVAGGLPFALFVVLAVSRG